MSWGWQVERQGLEIHIVPIQDRQPHATFTGCWCQPTPDTDEPRVIVHHSVDAREWAEMQRGHARPD